MIDTVFVNRVNQLSEQTIQLCYHCHKCTSGCPVADEMTFGPDRVLRMVQFGLKEELLTSHDIWVCASCETCGTRCPNEIDIARVMDALRQIAVAEGAAIAEPDSIKFHRVFLSLLSRMGRMHEASMMGLYLVWTLGFMDYMDTATKMLVKRKIPLIPRRIKGHKDVRRIFEATKEPNSVLGDS
jgi:heterodisulfide reductase subunit C